MAAKSRSPLSALKYEPRYCIEVMEFMGRGYSLTAFAGEIGASRAQLQGWCAKHPAFAEAVERAQAARARLLEDKMLTAKGASAFGAHMQALKTAAPHEWEGAKGRSATASRTTAAPAAQVELPDNGRE